jgi:hypothetical protein
LHASSPTRALSLWKSMHDGPSPRGNSYHTVSGAGLGRYEPGAAQTTAGGRSGRLSKSCALGSGADRPAMWWWSGRRKAVVGLD